MTDLITNGWAGVSLVLAVLWLRNAFVLGRTRDRAWNLNLAVRRAEKGFRRISKQATTDWKDASKYIETEARELRGDMKRSADKP